MCMPVNWKLTNNIQLFIILWGFCLFILFHFWKHWNNLLSHSSCIPECLVFPYLLLEKPCFLYHFSIWCFCCSFSFSFSFFFSNHPQLFISNFQITCFQLSHTFMSRLQTTFIKFLIISTPLTNAEVLFVCPMTIRTSYHHCKKSYKIKQNKTNKTTKTTNMSVCFY